ncbi:thioredoxin-like protein [Dunaliella salina]|uniref:Thioredoxin-like protein n=1 Tax=Dunaliella salina TaxID=3046 RepID=A0ABQ7FY35_DUNSA|nr:thioredoxin-like protein [Dunaliella salina]|eukprot:KAF5827260.1 thioredoxin-like protein [Dunaliella salina]
MALKDATSLQTVEAAASSGQLVVLHYWAQWCEPCKHMDKVMAQLAAEHPQATFMRVEAEEVDQATIKHEVTTVPSFVFIKGGAIVDRLEGADAAALSAKVAAATGANQQGASGVAGAGKEGLEERLKSIIHQQPVMLFMKGSPSEPRCGFSRKVADALNSIGVPFGSFDILSDQAVREGMKAYGNWPTFPQLYVKGELLGGCDIVLQMQEAGELKSTITSML